MRSRPVRPSCCTTATPSSVRRRSRPRAVRVARMAETDDRVELTDLDVIARYSLAVRAATADRDELIAALRSDLEWLQGSRSRRTTAPAPDAPFAAANPAAPAAPAVAAPAAATRDRRAPAVKKAAAKKAVPARAATATKKTAVKRSAAKKTTHGR